VKKAYDELDAVGAETYGALGGTKFLEGLDERVRGDERGRSEGGRERRS